MEYSNKRKQINSTRSTGNESAAVKTGAQDPAYQTYLQAVLAGRAKADSNTMGHRQDLAPSLAAKMSKAFGMDLSQMKLYRSNAMEGTETKGMASGNNIVLSKDIDLNTMAGQAVLGHEISHVRAQSQGIGMGHSGLYQNAGLEHQADVEGMMAARGQSILGESTGMDMGLGMGGIGGLTPLGLGMSASAGAPMQAKKPKKNKKSNAKTQKKAADQKQKASATKNAAIDRDELSYQELLENEMGFGKEGNYRSLPHINKDNTKIEYDAYKTYCINEHQKKIEEQYGDKYDIFKNEHSKLGDHKGFTFSRSKCDLNFILKDKSQDEFNDIVSNYGSMDENKRKIGGMAIKEEYHKLMKQNYQKYGTLLMQMDKSDVFNNLGPDYAAEMNFGAQIYDDFGFDKLFGGMDTGNEEAKKTRNLFNYANTSDKNADKDALKKKEEEFLQLLIWSDNARNMINFSDGTLNKNESYAPDKETFDLFEKKFIDSSKKLKSMGLDGGKGMNKKQLKAYKRDLEKRRMNGEIVAY